MNKNPTIEDYRKRLEESFDIYIGGIKIQTFDEYDDVIKIEDWIDAVDDGSFTDYDGYGNLTTPKFGTDKWIVSCQSIRPSDITRLKLTLPKWATHSVWYNIS